MQDKDIFENFYKSFFAKRLLDSRRVLEDAEKEAFAKLKENNKNVVLASLYKELHNAESMPFGLTAFRSHLRGYCTCLKN